MMSPESVEQIQTKIAFLERANTDLSDVVFRQQREIRALAARLKEIAQRLDMAQLDEPRSLDVAAASRDRACHPR